VSAEHAISHPLFGMMVLLLIEQPRLPAAADKAGAAGSYP
jgi:hypothetical protein